MWKAGFEPGQLQTQEYSFKCLKVVQWRVSERDQHIQILLFYSVLDEKCFIYKSHGECLIRSRNCLPFRSSWVHPRVLVGSVLLTFLVFCVKANLSIHRKWSYWFDNKSDQRRDKTTNWCYTTGSDTKLICLTLPIFILTCWYLQTLLYVM
jgi:hypothetical protein